MDISPITLKFKDKKHEKDFNNYYFNMNLKHGRACHILSLIFYNLFIISDFVIFSSIPNIILIVRFGIVTPMFLIGYILTYMHFESYKKIWQWQYCIYITISALGLSIIASQSPKHLTHIQNIAILFTLIFGYTFIRLRYLYATITGFIVILNHYIIRLYFSYTPAEYIYLEMLHILSTNILLIMIAYHLEKNARRKFELQEKMKTEKKALFE